MRKLIILSVIAFSRLTVSAQHESIYAKQWNEIDSLVIQKHLPKSALQKVNILYADAKEKSIHDEMIRALLYRFDLEETITDVDITKQVSVLKKELQSSNEPVSKAILQALLAENINYYYYQHAWENNRRKETVNYKEDDLSTWSNTQLIQTVDSLYAEVFSQEKLLQQTNTSFINAILIKGNMPKTRPTVYDLLAHEALDYYKTGLTYITQPGYAFTLNDEHSLATAGEFISYRFSSRDTTSHLLKALQLFQQLMQFRLYDTDPAAFIDADLERIEWVKNRAIFHNKDQLYKYALLDITNRFTNTKPAAEAWYALAKIETEKASSYQPLNDTTERYGYVKAKQLIDERLKTMPDFCFGNDEMKSLLADIVKPELNTQAESVNVPNEPFRLLVNYKNIDTLYARLLLQKDVRKAEKNKKYDKWRDIPMVPPVKLFQQLLPQTNDYQQHSVEIKIDPLPAGDYVLLISNSKDFNSQKDKLATQVFTVSNLAYMHNEFDYFVVDRETGQPLQNVKATGTIQVKNKNERWGTKKLPPLYTDSLGHLVIPVDKRKKENYGNVYLELEKGDDVLETSDRIFSYSYSYNNDDDDDEDDSTYEDDNSHVYFFTDRSIYRPGQTVFFKGIVLTKDRKTKQNKLYRYTDSIEVHLNDANWKTIDSMYVTLNEYGSFSGKFVLPQNALTGEFSIETLDFMEGEAEFNVEEYKRPTFYVEFDTLKGSYRLNDTIKVTGYAKAYAGNNIDNAKVSYNIQRSANFPYPYLFWKIRRPYSGSVEIADSIISIDANGKFEISFVATPDSSVDRKTEPVFDFEIELSVTDANGETREAKTSINIAYKSMVLQVNVPVATEVSKFKNIFITTKNSAGENIPASVGITISPLQAPSKAYRKRLWQQPDQFVMSKPVYETYFPYDEYEAETDYREWKKLDVVIKDSFNTTSTSDYKLQTANLKQGWYCIEALAKDKDGNEVKDVRYIQLYDMNAAGLPSPQVNFSQLISNSGQAGDKAQLLLGTSEENVFSVEKITANSDQDSLKYTQLNNNKKRIEYTIQPNDHDNIGLYYAFIKHNRFYTGGMQVYVNNDQKNLNITYASFRNKTEPGSKETWTVHVNNNNGEKADAELLTGMYDASLDQFKKQQWEIPYFNKTNYTGNNWEGDNYYAARSDEDWEGEWFYTPEKVYDHIARSAYEFLHVYEDAFMEKQTGFKIGSFNQEGDKSDVVDYDHDVTYMKIPAEKQLMGRAAGLAVTQGNALNEVVVTGYSTAKKNLTGSASQVSIRGISSLNANATALIIIDGVITEMKIDDLDVNEIDHIEVLKGGEAIASYGAKAANGAIVITTKEFVLRNGQRKEEQPPVQVRKNFNETAFFFPQLYADSAGNFSFNFTMPDALTQWKWMSFAHTKDLAFGLREENIITQKTLMVQPSLPRFLRQGDEIVLTAKISNLGDSVLNGTATVQLINAISGQVLNDAFKVTALEQNFSAEANRSTIIHFPVSIPLGYNDPLTVRIIAKCNNYSDGEEKTLPVLSNRVLVTETLPLYMPGEGTKEFKFEKLANNTSTTLTNESLTVEYTPDPAWYSVQALPYLIEFPHECAEQTFNRFYANALAANIISRHPRIKQVLETWSKDSTAFESALKKNEELKQILLNETPWVIDAENEAQQMKNIALLFDAVKMSNSTASALQQLKQLQMGNGAFAWFKGGYADRYITQYILTGIGRLKKMNAIPAAQQNVLDDIAGKALVYLDNEAGKDYNQLIKGKADLTKDHLAELQIQYWYMRSFFADENTGTIPVDALKFSIQQAEQYWMKQSPYMQGMLAVAFNRIFPAMKPGTKFKNTPLDIIHSLKENAVEDSIKGMYWKNNLNGYYWYESPVEAQALLIEAFKEILPEDSSIAEMRRWLILNKQTNNWGTTKATADACYALLSGNVIDSSQYIYATIHLGDSIINTANGLQQQGSGYIKQRIDGKNVQASMSDILVSVSGSAKNANPSSSYGAVYWQYFEDIDKISTASSPLSVSKKLFIEKNSGKGKILQTVSDNDQIKVGDKIVIRLVIKTDRNMEYIYLKDMRASSMEPVNVLSEYKWQDGLGYYESTKDAATNFFFDHLTKGTYILEYPVYVTHSGNFSAGIATIQCMYAPQFSAHSEGLRIDCGP